MAATLALPFILLYFAWRALRNPAYWSTLGERLGFLPRSFRQTAGGAIWLHAVSVGEVLSSVVLLRRLQAEFPGVPLFVSTTTLAGRALANEKLAHLAAGIFYAPVDLVFVVRRVLRTLRPWLVVVAETEIWPNLFREVRRAGSGLVIVNGRISDRAAPRYRAWRWFFRHVLRWPDTILTQTEAIRQLYLDLGAPEERVRVGGNLKYDFEPKAPNAALVRLPPGAKLWIAASTMPPALEGDPDEDDVVIETFRQLAASHPELRLMLAPRRPERFDRAAGKLEAAGIAYVRRSRTAEWTGEPGVLLLDTIGELSGLFALADVVFMGGTLASRGGHNILEPAFFARPVIIGPHMENFRAIAGEFRARQACVEIRDPGELAGAVRSLLESDTRELGRRALECAQANRGATGRAIEEIARVYADSVPVFRPPLPVAALLWPLARLWAAGSRLRPGPRGRLGAGVLSVGNLSMGGTGKTPFVLWLAARLPKPAILTRGYRRRSREKILLLDPGAPASPRDTGDEAQIFLRAGVAPVGIGADRVAAGRMLERRYRPEIVILDDGFQHTRLARDADIVLIDALDPLGGGDLFPLGRLREPLEALSRATAFVVTRAPRRMPGIERVLRRYNARAPVFYSRVSPDGWIEARTGRPVAQLPPGKVAAFCGLANPASFWRTLAQLEIRPDNCIAYRDHHRYGSLPQADVLLTTEKDLMNIPDPPPNLYWLKIHIEVEDADRLLALIRQSCFKPA